MDRRNSEATFFQDLWDRRLFQFFAAYLGSGWALIQFCEWLVARYGFNDALVDKLALVLLICLPSFLVFIYNHGRPGPDKWLPFEKVFIPASIIIAILSSLIFFSGEKQKFDYVELEDLNGDTLKRFIPIDNNFSFIGLFPFENVQGDESINYLSLAIPELLDYDLLQDSRIYPIHPFTLFKYSDFSFEKFFSNLSFSEKLKTTTSRRTDYFLQGTFEKEEEVFSISVEIFHSATGKSSFKKSYHGDNYFNLIDDINLDVINTLFPKELYPENEIIDLPASDLISSNAEVVENYIKGSLRMISNSEDPTVAMPFLEKAVQLDNDCSPCQYELANNKILEGGYAAGISNLELSVSLSSYLYDRMRFDFQERLFEVESDHLSQVKLLRLMIRLYPLQLSGYTRLMKFYEDNNITEGIKVGEEALTKGFARRINDKLANLYYLNGDYEKSKNLYLEHLAIYPTENKSKQQLVKAYIALDDFENARQLFEENTLLEPGSSEAFANYAEFERRFGAKFKISEDLLLQSLSKADSKKDSADLYEKISTLKNQVGELEEAIYNLKLMKELEYQYEIPLIVDFYSFNQLLNYYWELDSINEIVEIKDNYIREHSKVIPLTECLLNLAYAETFRDTTLFLNYYPSYRDSIKAFYGQESLLYRYYDGLLESFKGNNCEALDIFYEYYDRRGLAITEVPDVFITSAIECGKINRARELVDGNLKSSPHWPYYHFVSAKIYLLENQPGDAVSSLKKALEVLKNADPNHVVLKMVNELYDSLNAN